VLSVVFTELHRKIDHGPSTTDYSDAYDGHDYDIVDKGLVHTVTMTEVVGYCVK